MGTRKMQRRRFLGVASFAAILAASMYAYTASNTVPATAAGAGSGAISSYTTSNVGYDLNATNPANIDAVTFTIAPATAGDVRIKLASGGSWYSCSNSLGSVTCAAISPQATVSGASELTVLAVE